MQFDESPILCVRWLVLLFSLLLSALFTISTVPRSTLLEPLYKEFHNLTGVSFAPPASVPSITPGSSAPVVDVLPSASAATSVPTTAPIPAKPIAAVREPADVVSPVPSKAPTPSVIKVGTGEAIVSYAKQHRKKAAGPADDGTPVSLTQLSQLGGEDKQSVATGATPRKHNFEVT